jgi:hypothetical protein
MRRLATIAIVLAAALLPAAAQAAHPSQGNFGVHDFDVTFTNEDGTMATQAGSHPFALNISFKGNLDGAGVLEGWFKDLTIEQVEGLVADTTAYPRCTNAQFLEKSASLESACPRESVVGITALNLEGNQWGTEPVFNLTPPPGSLARFGFLATNANIVIDVAVKPEPPHNGFSTSRNISQLAEILASETQIWGDPTDPAHDELRGSCGKGGVELEPGEEFEFEGDGDTCPVAPGKPFLTLPTYCGEPLTSSIEALSWEGERDFEASVTHDAEGNPQPFTGCSKLNFKPSLSAKPTTRAAQSPSGLDLAIEVADEGLTSVDGLSQSRIRSVVLTLPEGMTANPSVAEGLEVCSEEDLQAETLHSAPGEGCPEASKLGTVEVETPLVGEPIKGALYQATPYANLADDSLIAFYFVLKNPNLGIVVKQTAKVVPDPATGQLVGITEEIPQLPFSSFKLHFREGGRSPLVSPPTCGTHTAKAVMTPWSGTAPITATSSFEIVSGPGEGPCPAGGTPPFEPGFEAGSVNNAAGRYSPFTMRLLRRDGDQDLTRFDATLPPGVVAKLAGVDKCSNAQIAAAEAKSGRSELASPSCPANSKIGRVISGAGVGSQLTYVPGSLYLAGPLGGAPLSAVAIVPAVAGPFDVGTVVVRQALDVNPRTAEVSADGRLSDPLPHILAGIPLSVREVQVHVDRQGFTLNPTSCEPDATDARIWGGGANPFSLADNSPVARSARYQAADCARLGFKPRLRLKLRGGTRRGAHPALRGAFTPRPGDANLKGMVLRLPRSAFLDQGHIRTICTRVRFAADDCPPGAIYGHARAFTPLLSEPLEGPVYLRSSDNDLPDIVIDLRGLVDVEAVARVDSKKGGIRVTFTEAPDAPITKVVVNMRGGKKGLIVNSANLCGAKRRAKVRLRGHNGKVSQIRPLVRAKCAGRRGRR